MDILQVVISIIMFSLSGLTFLLANKQFRERGTPLNNAYLFATEKERSEIDYKPYYRQSAITFIGCGIVFLILALGILLELDWLAWVAGGVSTLLIIYVIYSTISIARK